MDWLAQPRPEEPAGQGFVLVLLWAVLLYIFYRWITSGDDDDDDHYGKMTPA